MDVAQLLGHDHGVGIVEPHAAELGGFVDPKQSGIAQLLEDLVGGKDAVLLPLVDMRIDVPVDDRPQRAADLVMFLCELHSRLLLSHGRAHRQACHPERSEGPLVGIGKGPSLRSG